MKHANAYLALIACIATPAACLWADSSLAPNNQRIEIRGSKLSFVFSIESKGEFATPNWKSSFKIFQAPDAQKPVFVDTITNGLQQFDLQSNSIPRGMSAYKRNQLKLFAKHGATSSRYISFPIDLPFKLRVYDTTRT